MARLFQSKPPQDLERRRTGRRALCLNGRQLHRNAPVVVEPPEGYIERPASRAHGDRVVWSPGGGLTVHLGVATVELRPAGGSAGSASPIDSDSGEEWPSG